MKKVKFARKTFAGMAQQETRLTAAVLVNGITRTPRINNKMVQLVGRSTSVQMELHGVIPISATVLKTGSSRYNQILRSKNLWKHLVCLELSIMA